MNKIEGKKAALSSGERRRQQAMIKMIQDSTFPVHARVAYRPDFGSRTKHCYDE
jgi:hypothetical protein